MKFASKMKNDYRGRITEDNRNEVSYVSKMRNRAYAGLLGIAYGASLLLGGCGGGGGPGGPGGPGGSVTVVGAPAPTESPTTQPSPSPSPTASPSPSPSPSPLNLEATFFRYDFDPDGNPNISPNQGSLAFDVVNRGSDPTGSFDLETYLNGGLLESLPSGSLQPNNSARYVTASTVGNLSGQSYALRAEGNQNNIVSGSLTDTEPNLFPTVQRLDAEDQDGIMMFRVYNPTSNANNARYARVDHFASGARQHLGVFPIFEAGSNGQIVAPGFPNDNGAGNGYDVIVEPIGNKTGQGATLPNQKP